MKTNDIIQREILFHRDEHWLALEGCYWPALMRLIRAYGLDPSAYEAPPVDYVGVVEAEDTKALVSCIRNAISDIPHDDLWRFHCDNPARKADPYTCPPHEYFSGGGTSYLLRLIEFVSSDRFTIELTAPGTEYAHAGVMSSCPLPTVDGVESSCAVHLEVDEYEDAEYEEVEDEDDEWETAKVRELRFDENVVMSARTPLAEQSLGQFVEFFRNCDGLTHVLLVRDKDETADGAFSAWPNPMYGAALVDAKFTGRSFFSPQEPIEEALYEKVVEQIVARINELIRRDVDFVFFGQVAGHELIHMKSSGKFSMPGHRDSFVGFLLQEIEWWMTGWTSR